MTTSLISRNKRSRKTRHHPIFKLQTTLFVLAILAWSGASGAQCPWSKDLVDLHSDCICATNAAERLSIQCSPVDFRLLLTALKAESGGGSGTPIDLLYVNNASVPILEDDSFAGLDIQSLHLAKCNIENISENAFRGLNRVTSLNLQDNKLTKVPTKALKELSSLKQLDLSNNKITRIEDGAFEGLPITTLKLADNRKLVLSDQAFRGLEGTLKNLNMKGVGFEIVPKAVGRLSSVAFLDLAQNQISTIGGGGDNPLNGVSQLTALNLERNRIARLDGRAFMGVNSTLSSLSLLNNLLVEFPEEALSLLGELRVLDLGFNGIRKIPKTAFSTNSYLTLLALDGNPMNTLPEEAFGHLNTTLRGLSIGGSYLKCDCHLRWVAEWSRVADLQVTSRERNPQFCSSPSELRRKNFAQIEPEEFKCTKEEEEAAAKAAADASTTTSTTPKDNLTELPTTNGSPTKEAKSLEDPDENPNALESTDNVQGATAPILTNSFSITVLPPSASQQRVTMIDASSKDSSVTLKWDTDPRNNEPLLGFRVLYRFFGEKEFRGGAKLDAKKRNFTLEGLPVGQCLVVCVVEAQQSEDEVRGANNGSIPIGQCQEVKMDRHRDLDVIVIAASASVCAVIILAVVIFLCCFSRRRNKNKNSEKPRLPPTMPLHVSTVPAIKSEHEWESLSMYSGRSIPRARMYHQSPGTPNSNIGGPVSNPSFIYQEDTRSRLSSHSHVNHDPAPLILPAGSHVLGSPNGTVAPLASGPRSTADGQSHRSYSQLSTRFASDPHLADSAKYRDHGVTPASQLPYSTAGRPTKNQNGKSKKGRLASSSSLHSLTEYESDWTAANTAGRNHNWKDLEIDIYTGQNPVINGRSKYR